MDYFLAGGDQPQTKQPNDQAGSQPYTWNFSEGSLFFGVIDYCILTCIQPRSQPALKPCLGEGDGHDCGGLPSAFQRLSKFEMRCCSEHLKAFA